MTPEQLKHSILQLAIQGKLVEQRKEEGTGEELYKEIQEEKKKLIEEGKLKKQKSLPEITEDEVPFDIPETWKWVRSSDALNITMGQSPESNSVNYDNFGCEFHQGKSNFGNKFLNTSSVYTTSKNKIIESPAIVMSVRAPVGDVNLIKNQIFIGRGLAAFQIYTKCNLDYIFYYFLTIKKSLESVSTGSTFKAINSTTVKNIFIPLPPLAEQKRIVEKIEELLPLVDRYEKAWSRLEELNKKFLLDMQKSILQEAIQGKLVEQRKEEETGEELYKEIQEEKKKLIEEGKLKKQKSLPEITEDEVPFDIPETWKWVRSSDALNITMGQSPESNSVNYDNFGCEFHQGKSNFGNKFLNTSSVYTTSKNKIIESPAIVMSVRAPVGDVNLIKNQIFIGRGLAAFQIYTKCNLDYIFYYFLTIKKSLESVSTGSTFKAINSTTVKNIFIPLPPLAEQKRIVEKIEELLTVCEKLKSLHMK